MQRRLFEPASLLPGAPLDPHRAIAEAAKRIPKGVICLVFCELTDAFSPCVWVAVDQMGAASAQKRNANYAISDFQSDPT